LETGAYGEVVTRKAVAVGIQTKQLALMAAQQIAEAHERHGFKREHGLWWYREGDTLFRLVVE
jgi:hypothetical protein